MSGLYASLLAFQSEAPALQRDSINPHFKNRYVSLTRLVESVLPLLNKHGLVLLQEPCIHPESGFPVLLTKIVHAETGETEQATMPLAITKTDPQGQGSALTYARRYALMAFLGLVADDDDDGERATQEAQSAAPPRPEVPRQPSYDNGGDGPTEKQRRAIFGLLKKMSLSEADVVKAYGSGVTGLSKKNASELIDRLKTKEGELASVAPGEPPSQSFYSNDPEPDIPF